MNLTRNQIIIIGIGAVIAIVAVLMFMGIIPGLNTSGGNTQQKIKLTVAGPLEKKDVQVLIDAYTQLRSNVEVSYVQFPAGNYESALLDNLAAGRSPDIIIFRNSWLPKHSDKLVPVAESQFPLATFENTFPKVAEQNFTSSGKIYALPLYIDTLALIYNKDIFDAKTIPLPPRTWNDIQTVILRTRELNNLNQLAKPALAIGGSAKSVDNAADILNNIFLQYGNPTQNSYGGLAFTNDGLNAFNFYLQFGNPSSQYYTWNDNLKHSLDSFANSETAMILDYASSLTAIKNKNSFLNFGVAPFPQFTNSQPINYADYWGLAVSKQSLYSAWAWDFILNTAGNATVAENFFKSMGEVPAMKTLINKYQNDPAIGVFVAQALTARAWPEPNHETIQNIFSGAIQSVLSGQLSSSQAFEQIKSQIDSLR